MFGSKQAGREPKKRKRGRNESKVWNTRRGRKHNIVDKRKFTRTREGNDGRASMFNGMDGRKIGANSEPVA